MIHFMIGLSQKIWGPIEIWSWPPGVLNDPLENQWIPRKLVRSTIFYQISLLKFCLHHLKDLYQIYRLKWSILWLACSKNFEGPLKFDPDHLSCLMTRWTNNEFKGNLCGTLFSNKFTYWNSVCTISKSSVKRTDWNDPFYDWHVQKNLRAHWNLILTTWCAQRPAKKPMNSKETYAKHYFPTNSPIEILFAPFERALLNLQTEIIHFVIGLSK